MSELEVKPGLGWAHSRAGACREHWVEVLPLGNAWGRLCVGLWVGLWVGLGGPESAQSSGAVSDGGPEQSVALGLGGNIPVGFPCWGCVCQCSGQDRGVPHPQRVQGCPQATIQEI